MAAITNTSASIAADPTARKPRRMAREPMPGAVGAESNSDGRNIANSPKPPKAPSKLDQVEALLLAPTGASIAELVVATGWQQHSVRGAMAGALKKRGLAITSDKVDGLRRYRAKRPA